MLGGNGHPSAEADRHLRPRREPAAPSTPIPRLRFEGTGVRSERSELVRGAQRRGAEGSGSSSPGGHVPGGTPVYRWTLSSGIPEGEGGLACPVPLPPLPPGTVPCSWAESRRPEGPGEAGPGRMRPGSARRPSENPPTWELPR